MSLVSVVMRFRGGGEHLPHRCIDSNRVPLIAVVRDIVTIGSFNQFLLLNLFSLLICS